MRRVRDRFRDSLTATVTGISQAYGFALTLWGTSAIVSHDHGPPDAVDVFLALGAAIAAIAVVSLVAFGGVMSRWDAPDLNRRAFGAIHLLSVGSATVAGWGASALLDGRWAWLAAPGVAVLVFLFALALEIAASTDPGAG
jgi:hypothetical protein